MPRRNFRGPFAEGTPASGGAGRCGLGEGSNFGESPGMGEGVGRRSRLGWRRGRRLLGKGLAGWIGAWFGFLVAGTGRGHRRPSATGTKAVVDRGLCRNCGTCIEVCREHAMSMRGDLVIDLALCTGCGLCVPKCRKGALRLEVQSPFTARGGLK